MLSIRRALAILSIGTLAIGSGLVLLSQKHLSSSSAYTTIPYVKALYALPVTFDPTQMDDTASLVFSELVYEGLVRFKSSFEIEGGVAKRWSTSPDGRVLTFELDPSAKFHDGSPVTAADVVYSLNRAVNPKSKVYNYYDCILGARAYHNGKASSVIGLKILNLTKIQIELEKPFPPFLSVLAGATAKILPKNRADQKELFEHPIGSGPFEFIKREIANGTPQIVLRRFGGYSGLRPKIETMILKAPVEAKAREEALAGKIHDLSNWPLTGREEVFSIGQHFDAEVADTWIIGLNSRLAPFKELASRQAFKASFDSEAFRQRFYPDAVPAFGYIPPGFPGYRASRESFVSSGKVLPSLKSIQVAIPLELARHREIAQFIQQSFASKGWKVSVVALSWAQMMKRYSEKSLQAFLLAMNLDYPDTEFLLRNFESSNPDNFSGFHDRDFDKLLEKARSTQDRVARDALYERLASRVDEEALTINLFHPRAHYWVSKCVTGFAPSLLLDAYIDYRTVSISDDCVSAQKIGFAND